MQSINHTSQRSPSNNNNARQAPRLPICKLPDDILLKIANNLDLVSLAQLLLTTTKFYTPLFFDRLNYLKDKKYLQTYRTCLEKAYIHLKKINPGQILFLNAQANTSNLELGPNNTPYDQKKLCLKAKSCARIAHLYKEIDQNFAKKLFNSTILLANEITDQDIKTEIEKYIESTKTFTTKERFRDGRYQIKQYIKSQKGLIIGSQSTTTKKSKLFAFVESTLEQTKTNPTSAKEICREAICAVKEEPDLAERDRLLSMICLAQIKIDKTLGQKDAHKTLKMLQFYKFKDKIRLQLATKQAILDPNQKKDIAMAKANKIKIPEFQIQAYCNIAATQAKTNPKDAIKTLENAIRLLKTMDINLAESRESNKMKVWCNLDNTNQNALLCYICLTHAKIDPTLTQKKTINLIDNIQDETLKIIILCFIASKCWQQTQK